MDFNLWNFFPGITTLFVQEPIIAVGRIVLICFGFLLAYLGFKRTLEPLIMIPMGLGMISVNAGVLFLSGTTTELMPVVEVDGRAIGGGRPGPVARRLQSAFRERT